MDVAARVHPQPPRRVRNGSRRIARSQGSVGEKAPRQSSGNKGQAEVQQAAAKKHGRKELVFQMPEAVTHNAYEPQKGDPRKRHHAPVSDVSVGTESRMSTCSVIISTAKIIP